MSQPSRSGPAAAPLLSLVIPVHGNLEQTQACLASLRRQRVSFPFEVVIVDDGSGPEMARALASTGAGVISLPENRGYPAAVNAGVAATRGEFVLALNNDTILGEETLERMVRALRSHPDIGVVGPNSDRVKGSQMLAVKPVDGDPEAVERQAQWLADQYDGKVEDIFYVVGMAMLFPRQLWDEVGGFDEAFGPGNFEDDDFCLRVRDLGRRIVIARDTFVHHLSGTTFTSLKIDYRALLDRNQEIYLTKWRHHPVLGAYVAKLQKDPPRALFNCRAALTQGSRNHEALHILGETLLEMRQPREALAALERLLKVAPRYTSAMLLKTLCLIDLDREKAAREAMAALLLDFYMCDRTAGRMLTFFADACLGWHKEEEAEGYYQTALDFLPNCPEALCGLAARRLERGDRPAARELLERAPESTLAKAMLGTMHWEEGDLTAARRSFAEALRLDPDHAESRDALMRLDPNATAPTEAESAGLTLMHDGPTPGG